MSNTRTIQHCRNKIVSLSNELRQFQKERDYLIDNLNTLNSRYLARELSYEDYSSYWNSLLADFRYYEKYSQLLQQQLREQEIELEHLRTTETNVQLTKVVSITLVLALILIAGLAALNIEVIPGITGYAGAEANTTTLAEIQYYYALGLSSDLSDGLEFTVPSDPYGKKLNNATENYNTTNHTQIWVTLNNDSNTQVDTCVKANTNLTDSVSGFVISVGNMSWANASVNSPTQPSVTDATRYNFSYALAMKELDRDNNNYFRLWVDIPITLVPGTYNNTIQFKAIRTGTSC